MKLFSYHFRKKLWLFPVMIAYMVWLVFLPTHSDFFAYHMSTEMYMSFWTAILSAFVLTSEAETEFAVCYGVSFVKLGFAQWMPHFLYPLLTAFLACPLYFRMFDFGAQSGREFAAESARYTVLLFSIFVTFFFLSALMLFVRILTRNLYVSFASFVIFFFAFHEFRRLLLKGIYPPIFVKYDIWLTGFLFEKRFGVTQEMWLCNRYIYLGLAFLLIFLSFFLLKQKNYENFRS